MPDEGINVVFATDLEYLVPTFIAAFSMMMNHTDSRRVDIYIMTPANYPMSEKTILEQLPVRFPNCSVRFLNMEDSFAMVRINCQQTKVPTMYRLMIPGTLKNLEKCIYLDSDLIVEGDIAELYDIDVNRFCIAGVRDIEVYNFGKSVTEWQEKLKIPSLNDYINAGVLVINLKEIRGLKLDGELVKAGYNNQYSFNDQDAINNVCYGRIKLLPIKYNIIPRWVWSREREIKKIYKKDNVSEARKQPFIIHYAGITKPWCKQHSLKAKRWWKYVNRQNPVFKEELLISFVEKQKEILYRPIGERIKNYLVARLWRLGLYFAVKRLVDGR